MTIKHVYTVVREYEILPDELDREVDFFKGAISDEPGEYLYGGSGAKETITVELQVGNN